MFTKITMITQGNNVKLNGLVLGIPHILLKMWSGVVYMDSEGTIIIANSSLTEYLSYILSGS